MKKLTKKDAIIIGSSVGVGTVGVYFFTRHLKKVKERQMIDAMASFFEEGVDAMEKEFGE